MPVYEYECGAGCGSFSAGRPMSASALPAPCPSCGHDAGRILSATAVRGGRGRRRRGVPEPKLVTRDHDPGRPSPSPSHGHGHAHGAADRPWMLGH